jgi:hypothetical protein
MLSVIIKALNDNDFNTTTRAQQTHNNFYSVEFLLRQIRLLLCYCCVCNNLTTCILNSFTTKQQKIDDYGITGNKTNKYQAVPGRFGNLPGKRQFPLWNV